MYLHMQYAKYVIILALLITLINLL